MWKLIALVAICVIACLAPFWLLGLKFFGPIAVATVADWFCHG